MTMTRRRTETTLCSNAYCPRVHDLQLPANMAEREVANVLSIHKSDALRDTSGNYWCPRCKARYDLLNWAKAHNWCAIYAAPYAVAQEEPFWNTAVKLGTDGYVEALYNTIFRTEGKEV